MSVLLQTNCCLATPASIKTASALRCSKEQQELAAERAAVKEERAALDRMRAEFEAELQQARGEMQRAQDALQGGQQRGALPKWLCGHLLEHICCHRREVAWGRAI